MPSNPGKFFTDQMMKLTIKQVVDENLLNGSGSVSIDDRPTIGYFPAHISGNGRELEVTVCGGWGNTRQRVGLTTSPCNYGGVRYWFVCPGCLRRCGVLYVHEQIACRKCHKLAYESQYEPVRDRMLRKLLKIRKLIGCDMDIFSPFNPPPKGMSVPRWKNLIREYEELREKYVQEAERVHKWRKGAPKVEQWKLGVSVPKAL